MKLKRRRRTLQRKVNDLVLGIVLALAAGLMSISYYVFCQDADERNDQMLERAAVACAENVYPEMVQHFWNEVNTDEYRELRERALEADDEQMIVEWMQSRPGWFELVAEEADGEEPADGADKETSDEEIQIDPSTMWTLMDEYETMRSALVAIIDYLNVDSAYYQIDIDGVAYNIADPAENIFYIGTAEEPIPEFDGYPDNSRIPPIVFRSDFGWLCTAIEPMVIEETGEVVGIAGVDINMTDVIQERQAFLLHSLVFVAVLTVAALAISMFLMRRVAVHPLQQLSKATVDFAREDHAFTKDDIIQLDIRSNDEISDLYEEIQSMQTRIVDYTDNLTRVTAERERVSTELRTASKIQEAMLPRTFPAFPDRTEFDLYASMDPAKEVGGDFYDFFLLDDTHLAVVIADVSDKGVPAALFMMASKIILNYRAHMGGSPSEILSAVNAQICKSNETKMFVTVWLGILDLETGILTCSNAGHEYPFVRGGDGVFRLYKDRHGLVVGAMVRSKYSDYEIQMHPGDAIFVYTDGVPEANNADGGFYGMERLEEALNRTAGLNPKGILLSVKENVDIFTGEAKQFDDLTMLCLEYKGGKKETH